jgi:hypothetical protein
MITSLSFTVQTNLSAALGMPAPEIRHTTSAQPTRMIRFHVRTRQRQTDRPSPASWLEGSAQESEELFD